MRICYLPIFLALTSCAMGQWSLPTPVLVASLVLTMVGTRAAIPHFGYYQSLSGDDGTEFSDFLSFWQLQMRKINQEEQGVNTIEKMANPKHLADDYNKGNGVSLQVEFPVAFTRIARSPEESGDPGEKLQEMGQKGAGMASKGFESGQHGAQAGAEGAKGAQSAAEGVGQGAGVLSSGAEVMSSGMGQGKTMTGAMGG